MNFRYYETLPDKSKDYILPLIEQIVPKLSNNEINIFFEDSKKNSSTKTTKTKSKTTNGFVSLEMNSNDDADLTKLSSNQLKKIYQIFISREDNNKLAIKWRFYNFLKYNRDFDIKNIQLYRENTLEQVIDFIIETDEDEKIIVCCFDILDLKTYTMASSSLVDFLQKLKFIPNRVIFAANKSYRNIPINNPIDIDKNNIIPELWIEFIEVDCPFRGEDLIIVENSDLKIAGFNFTSIKDLLDYVFKFSKKGQISIFKEIDYLLKDNNDTNYQPEIELIWKGIMVKK